MNNNNSKGNIIIALLLVFFCVSLCYGQEKKQTETFLLTGEYVDREIGGFTIKIAKFAVDSTVTQQALDRLTADIRSILFLYTKEQLKVMQQKPIWLEVALNPDGAACYHPSKQWLSENGMNPDKAQCVEISNMRNYVKWTAQNQPCMLLHELSHLYHHQGLPDGYENAQVKNVYMQAKASEKYEAVKYYNGRDTVVQRAYAMNNQMEYFAELSEAYFGHNDYFPFTYGDLKIFDPAGFALMEEIWGKRE